MGVGVGGRRVGQGWRWGGRPAVSYAGTDTRPQTSEMSEPMAPCQPEKVGKVCM